MSDKIKFKKASRRACPICGGPSDELNGVFIGHLQYKCGMVLRRSRNWWKVKSLCDYAYDDDMRPYVRTVLSALYHQKRTVKAITKFLKKCGWTGQTLVPENVELALRVLDKDWGIGLAEGTYEP